MLPQLQELDVVNSTRVESGPVRFIGDRPGLFMRGEDAELFAMDIDLLNAHVRSIPGGHRQPLEIAMHNLSIVAEIIKAHVRAK